MPRKRGSGGNGRRKKREERRRGRKKVVNRFPSMERIEAELRNKLANAHYTQIRSIPEETIQRALQIARRNLGRSKQTSFTILLGKIQIRTTTGITAWINLAMEVKKFGENGRMRFIEQPIK